MAEARDLSEYEEIEKKQTIKLVDDVKTAQKPKPQTPKRENLIYTIAYILMGLVSLMLVFTTINVENKITSVSNDIVKVQYSNADKETEINNLKQEKNELSRVDRIMKIAKEGGLTVNDNNIRKVGQ